MEKVRHTLRYSAVMSCYINVSTRCCIAVKHVGYCLEIAGEGFMCRRVRR